MLQHKYLPVWNARCKQSILIAADVSTIYPLVVKLDFSSSRIVRWLFKLRGLPTAGYLSLQGLSSIRFHPLEEKPGEELILGIIGKFWSIKGYLQQFTPQEFLSQCYPQYGKAAWSFQLIPVAANKTLLETETRVYCAGARNRLKFRIYWLIIRPFSRVIRREILKCIKQQAEQVRA